MNAKRESVEQRALCGGQGRTAWLTFLCTLLGLAAYMYPMSASLQLLVAAQSAYGHGPVSRERTTTANSTALQRTQGSVLHSESNDKVRQGVKSFVPSAVRAPLTLARVLHITYKNRELVYLPLPDILFTTMAKGGTTTTWHWLYHGMTGRAYNMTECATYVQDVRSACWGKHATYLYTLPASEQRRVLTSRATLRVAVQRDPFARLVSAYKSKFACEGAGYGTDARNRATMVPALLRQAGVPRAQAARKACLSVTEFARAVDAARRNVGRKGFVDSLRRLDVHIRPQEFYFGEVEYDMVLDVADLGNRTRLAAVARRLPFATEQGEAPRRRHASSGEEMVMGEETARLLHRFAVESKTGPLKYLPEVAR